MQKKMYVCAQLALLVVLFWYMWSNGMVSWSSFREGFLNFRYSLIGVFLLFLCSVLGSMRWFVLLRDQGIKLSFYRVFELSFIGNFFNTVLPGNIAGEAMKTYYLDQPREQTQQSIAAILLDRFIGMSCLFLGAAMALLLHYNKMKDLGIIQHVQGFLWISGAIFFILYIYIFLVPQRFDILYKGLQWLHERFQARTVFFQSLSKIYLHLKSYQAKKTIIFQIIAFSLIMQSLAVASYVFFSYALGDFNIIISGFFLTVPLVLLLCSLPIAPAGLGAGNLAFYYFGQFLGTQKGADIFSMAAFSVMLVNCLGVVFYIKFQFQRYFSKPQI